MEGEEGPTPTVTVTTSTPPPSPPHNTSDVSPVGSPDKVEHTLAADDPGQAPGGGLTDDLKLKIIKQVEYYFSDENLLTDKYMLSVIQKNKGGFVPIPIIGSFKKMNKLTRDYSLIAAALKDSSLLVVSANGKKVKRVHPLPSFEPRDPKQFTVFIENLPADHSVENLKKMFSEAGSIKDISIVDPSATDSSSTSGKVEKPLSNKLHALVEYDTVEATEKAVAILNNEEDWRNGMRVKLLKQMYGQSGQRRQLHRGYDSEKSNSSRTSDSGTEEAHKASEQHIGTPEEDHGAGHMHKEKSGHRGRGRGQGQSGGRQKYHRNLNGIGHGTSSLGHPTEPSNHHQARKCLMEPEDSQWDAAALQRQTNTASCNH